MNGTLYGIGIGPGDPELITLKAQRYLKQCPIIAFPKPLGGESLAYRIAVPHLPKNTRHQPIEIPMLNDSALLNSAYDTAAENITGYLQKGLDVGYVCEGDPMFYGSFIYLMQRLKAHFDIEIVPGVSSIMAGAAAIRQALAMHDQSLVILPGTLSEEILQHKLAEADQAILIKIGRHFDKICRVLQKLGRFEYSDYIAYATMEQQNYCPLSLVKNQQIPYFSLIYVRHVTES